MTRDEIIEAIRKERDKAAERWGDEHDDEHDTGQLAEAAAYYANGPDHAIWPFDDPPKRYPNRTRELIVAAAFIVSEIERLERRKR